MKPRMPPTPEKLVYQIQKLLNVETIDLDLYRGMAIPGGTGRVFGGQVIGQALIAACNTVDDSRQPHSLHAFFLRAGDNTKPIIYRVVRDYDGGSFTNRRVIATQNGQPILNMAASFQVAEDGMEHSTLMPDVPPPMGLLSTCAFPHGVDWFTPSFQSASLDHTIWFHEDVKADEWMLYSMDSPWGGHARGLNRGMIFSRDGRLIASTAQEGLMRMRKGKGLVPAR